MKKPEPFDRHPSPPSSYILPDQPFHGYINPEAKGDHPNFRSYLPGILLPNAEEQNADVPKDYPGPLHEDGLPLDQERRKSFEAMPPGYLRYRRWLRGQGA